jgi:molybdopterin-guanine dinucleotide biosynthesis protein A
LKLETFILELKMPAGIILCGGQSSRMGYPKAWLPFGLETMLQRIARILSEVVSPLVIVAAPDQELPPISFPAIIARDAREGRGPLEGLLAGLSALPPHVDAAYVTGCDVPLLSVEFVTCMLSSLGDAEAAVPVEEQFVQPLAAVYRRRVIPVIEDLIAQDRMRPAFLFDRVSTNRVPAESLRVVDPQLQSLANLNRPEDYLAALAAAGFACPEEIRQRLNAVNARIRHKSD